MTNIHQKAVPAEAFLAECDALSALLSPLSDRELLTVTQFKDWTIEDIIAHLHMWNYAACLTLCEPDTFKGLINMVMTRMGAGDDHRTLQRHWLDSERNGIHGRSLFEEWREFYPILAKAYAEADSESRVTWFGPDMTVGNKLIARQMETWAHGQAIFDIMGLERVENDRLYNIAHLGVTTYSFAFRNRGLTPPTPKPYINLTAPSGTLWNWNEPQDDNVVTGDAVSFCQTVTQTRNSADTNLQTKGHNATNWISIAQCFAGPPHDPPAPGTRFVRYK